MIIRTPRGGVGTGGIKRVPNPPLPAKVVVASKLSNVSSKTPAGVNTSGNAQSTIASASTGVSSIEKWLTNNWLEAVTLIATLLTIVVSIVVLKGRK